MPETREERDAKRAALVEDLHKQLLIADLGDFTQQRMALLAAEILMSFGGDSGTQQILGEAAAMELEGIRRRLASVFPDLTDQHMALVELLNRILPEATSTISVNHARVEADRGIDELAESLGYRK